MKTIDELTEAIDQVLAESDEVINQLGTKIVPQQYYRYMEDIIRLEALIKLDIIDHHIGAQWEDNPPPLESAQNKIDQLRQLKKTLSEELS